MNKKHHSFQKNDQAKKLPEMDLNETKAQKTVEDRFVSAVQIRVLYLRPRY